MQSVGDNGGQSYQCRQVVKKVQVDNEDVGSASASICGSMDVKTLDEIKDLGEGQHVNVMEKIQSIEPVAKVIIKTGTEE